MRPIDSGLSNLGGEEMGSGKDLRLSMVLGDAELELFDSIELIASLSYLLQVRSLPLLYSCLNIVGSDKSLGMSQCVSLICLLCRRCLVR
jgi:hypothetical protein